MHLYVARAAYSIYENQLRIQTQMILDNSKSYTNLCPDLRLQCYEINSDQIDSFNLSNPNVINRIRFWEDTKTESDNLVKELVHKVNNGVKNEDIFMESNINTDNLRAATYGIKKLPNNRLLIVIDFNNLAFALDLYLLYFTLIINIFLIFWTSAIIWTYKKHKTKSIVKSMELI
jgi:hypothetical protein